MALPHLEYDYIIIGGGTAGLVVASRLSEDCGNTVLVIEAGADHRDDPLVQIPGLVPGLYGQGEYDWNFSSVPQVYPLSLCTSISPHVSTFFSSFFSRLDRNPSLVHWEVHVVPI